MVVSRKPNKLGPMLLLNSDRRFESTNRNPWSEFVYDLHKHREGPTLDQRWPVCSSCWSAIYVLNWGTPGTPRFIWRAMSLYFPIHFYLFVLFYHIIISPKLYSPNYPATQTLEYVPINIGQAGFHHTRRKILYNFTECYTNTRCLDDAL